MRNPFQLHRIVGRWIHAGTAGSGFPKAAGVPKKRGFLWWASIGAGLGTVMGGYTAYDNYVKKRTVVANSSEDFSYVLQDIPKIPPSRSKKFATDTSGLKLTLFQYQTCPFCCKVRAMLDYFGVSYDVVEVNPVLRTQMKWSQNYKKVPILLVETPQGETLQLVDSSMIVSALSSYFLAHQNGQIATNGENSMHTISKFYPTVKYNDETGKQESEIMNKYFLMLDGDMSGRTKEDVIEERKWRKWADTVFVHTLSPNIYRTIPEALDSFRNFDKVGEWEKNFSSPERTLVIYVGALAMWMIGKRLQKRHNLKTDVRQSLYEESDIWMKTIQKKGGDFMGGSKPNLADLAVYGVLNSIEGCEAFNDLSSNSEIISKWYRKVQENLKDPSRL